MISTGKFKRRAGFGELTVRGICMAAALFGAAAVSAQEVVQPLPSQASRDLNSALRTLGSDPRNLSALQNAGEAALDLNDTDAALGFFRRAEAVSPGNPRTKAGMARVNLAKGEPVEAVRLFNEAEAGGFALAPYNADRGLAHDLAGDTVRAQQYYRAALALGDDPMTRRRLALSQAISGDAQGSESTLLPLLQSQDRAAYRTRAFALAIVGRTEEAVTISEAMLPQRLATQLTPYLRLMPRLTPAQQAAAANLGQFPASGDMGRDEASIAAYAPSTAPVSPAPAARGSDTRLAPAGEPLGRTQQQPQVAERQVTGGRLQVLPPTPIESAGSTKTEPVVVARQSTPGIISEPVTQALPVQSVAAQQSTPGVISEPVTQPLLPGSTQGVISEPVTQPVPPRQASVQAGGELPPIDIAATPASTPQPSISIAPEQPVPVPAKVDLSEAFSEFTLAGSGGVDRPAGAVDITAFEPPREKVEPKPPAVPSRHWVQVATGQDVSALGFDWRRIRRNSGGLLEGSDAFTATWGQTNRLVTGPFATGDAAQELVTKLKEQGIDSFRFTSAQGEEVRPLD